MNAQIVIRRYSDSDAGQVRDLFIKVNRLLAPANLVAAFDRYIEVSLRDEIDRIPDYYREKQGGFWVASLGPTIVGMFGLERTAPSAMELRRMYVDPDRRRQGIGAMLLQAAERQCLCQGLGTLELSTSEAQPAALQLYRRAGYRLLREETVTAQNNKTIGAGIRRYYFEKDLYTMAGL